MKGIKSEFTVNALLEGRFLHSSQQSCLKMYLLRRTASFHLKDRDAHEHKMKCFPQCVGSLQTKMWSFDLSKLPVNYLRV